MRTITCRVLLAGVALFWPIAGRAQNCDTQGLDAMTYRRVLHERFAALYSPRPGGVPGTFASLDIKDAEATFANAAVFESGAVLGVKARGGIAEGILPFLDNQAVNAKLGIDVQLNFLGRGRTALQYTNESCVAYKAALLKATNDSILAAVEIGGGYLRILKNVEIDRLTRKSADLKRIIDTSIVQARKESLTVERAKVDTLTRQVRDREVPTASAQRDFLRRKTAAARRAARSLLAIRGYAFGWWSLGYALSNTKFRLFDPSAAFASQVKKRSYVSQTVGLSYSRYALTSASGESRFLSIGIHGGVADNLAKLTKVELTDMKNFGPTPQERVGTTKYTAYQGAYEKDLRTATLSGDYYSFLLFKNQGAIHLYPAVTVEDKLHPTYAAGVGFLVVSRKDKEGVLNAELYFNMTDLTNSNDSEHGFIGRSGLGLRFTFPITFGPVE
jgi:hypothetical protein